MSAAYSSSPDDESDDTVAAMSNDQLETMWETVQGSHKHSVSKTLPIGIKEGESRFEIKKFKEKGYNRKRVPREDGRYTKENDDEGDHFGPEWRRDQITREGIIFDDPNYQFLTLVAGAANARVEQLYDEDSVGRMFRLKLQERVVEKSIAETRVELQDLRDQHLARLKVIANSEQFLARLQERIRSDPVITEGNYHILAMKDYIEQVLENNKQRDMGYIIEMSRPEGFSCPGSGCDIARMKRVIEHFGDEVPTDMKSWSEKQILEMLFWDRKKVDAHYPLQYEKGSVGSYLGEVHKTLSTNGTESWVAPALQRALIRLVTTLIYDDGETMHEYVGTELADLFENYDEEYDRNSKSNSRLITELVESIDEISKDRALDYVREKAWRNMVLEAVALHDMLTRALAVLQQRSFLDIPDILEPKDEEKTFIFDVKQDFITDFRKSMTDLARVANSREALSAKSILDSLNKDENDDKFTLSTLRTSGLLMSVRSISKEDDPALHSFLKNNNLENETLTDSDILKSEAWISAMAHYEKIGGWIFRSGLSDVEFPSQESQRTKVMRGIEEVSAPLFNAKALPPNFYSKPMRDLWTQHIPILVRAVEKASSSKKPLMALPESIDFTFSEGAIYREMTANISYNMPAAFSKVWSASKAPVIVFAVQLYRAALEMVRLDTERSIELQKDVLRALDERIESKLRGEPFATKPVDVYQHRRGWVERPENSGYVRMIPIVTKGIGSAWQRLQRLAPNITDKVDIEFLQHDPNMREDFAELVAVEMSLVAQRFPKQYLQLGIRIYSAVDLVNVVQRFQKNHIVRSTGIAQPPARKRARTTEAWETTVKPTVSRTSSFVLV